MEEEIEDDEDDYEDEDEESDEGDDWDELERKAELGRMPLPPVRCWLVDPHCRFSFLQPIGSVASSETRTRLPRNNEPIRGRPKQPRLPQVARAKPVAVRAAQEKRGRDKTPPSLLKRDSTLRHTIFFFFFFVFDNKLLYLSDFQHQLPFLQFLSQLKKGEGSRKRKRF